MAGFFEVFEGDFGGGEVVFGEEDGGIADADLVAISERGFLFDLPAIYNSAVPAVEVEGVISTFRAVVRDLQVTA